MAARDDPESLILGPLKARDRRRRRVREPNWRPVVDGRRNVRLKEGDQGLFGAAPRGASQGAKETSLLVNSCNDPVDVRSEGEVGVEGDAEEFGATVEG